MRITIEMCSSIVISSLQREIRRIILRDYVDPSQEEILALTKKKLEEFSLNGQHFEYTHIRNHLGGYRWFFLCPKCKKRIAKLFLPPEGSTLEPKYLCKDCHGITNQSALMGQNRIYKNVTRPLKRMRAIEKKLETGHKTPEKVKELLDEYDALDRQMKSTTEYRLYVFKKQRERDRESHR